MPYRVFKQKKDVWRLEKVYENKTNKIFKVKYKSRETAINTAKKT